MSWIDASHSTAVALAGGLAGMVGWGLADFFAKKTIDVVGDITTLLWAHLCGTALILAAWLVAAATGSSPAMPGDLSEWGGLAAFGVLQGVVYLLVYRGFAKGQVAVLAPVFASFSGVVALVSVLFLGEAVSAVVAAGLLTIFAGIVALNVDPVALRAARVGFLRVPGLPEVAVAALLAAAWTLGWNAFVSSSAWLSYAALMYMFMSAFLVVYVVASRQKVAVGWRGAWKYLVLIGACEILAYAGVSWGYGATSRTSIVALVSGAFSLPTIVLARIFLKERTGWLQALASGLIVIGIALLNSA